MSRYRVALMLIALIAAGCSSSNSSSKKSKTVVTPSGYVGTVPAGTPLPTPKHRAVTPGTKLPTPKPAPHTTPSPLPSKAFTAVIFGKVTDAKTHKPISGALVSVASGRKTAKTSADGTYRIAFPGRIFTSIQVTKHGYYGPLEMGSLKPHASLHYDFKLTRVSASSGPQPPGTFKSP